MCKHSESAREVRTALYKGKQQQQQYASLISLMVSVDVKHHVYLLNNNIVIVTMDQD